MQDKERSPSAESIEEACLRGILCELANEYILSCNTQEKEGECEKIEERESRSRKKDNDKGASKFPNVAGFCRYFGIGRGRYERLSKKYPEEFEKLSAVFEDEALNSQLSPSLLSAYLKRRLGYGETADSATTEADTAQLKLIFDHDIFIDGE
jgi:hypothetical protein